MEEGATTMEVLKSLVAIFSKLSKHVQGTAPAVLGQCCNLFSRCLPLYQRTKVLAGSDEDDDAQVSCQPKRLDPYPLAHLEVVLLYRRSRQFDAMTHLQTPLSSSHPLHEGSCFAT